MVGNGGATRSVRTTNLATRLDKNIAESFPNPSLHYRSIKPQAILKLRMSSI